MNYIENSTFSTTKNINLFIKEQPVNFKEIECLENNQKITMEIDTSILFLVKITFIYSAVMDGWKVEKLNNNKFSFTKKNVLKHISLQSFIDKHLHTQNLVINK